MSKDEELETIVAEAWQAAARLERGEDPEVPSIKVREWPKAPATSQFPWEELEAQQMASLQFSIGL